MANTMLNFEFFDKEVVTYSDGQPFQAFEDVIINCTASGHGALLFGDNDGTVYMVTRSFEVASFQAYEEYIQHMYQLKTQGILVTVGSDEEGIARVIKIWNVDRVLTGGQAQLLRTITITHPKPMVTCIAAHESLKHLAVGMADGTVLVAKGDITRERSSNRSLRQSFHSKDPVMGLSFHPSQGHVSMYVVTTAQVVMNALEPQERIEELGKPGVPLKCSAIADDGNLWLAAAEELSMYMPEGRGGSLPFPGTKQSLQAARGYLVCVYEFSRDGALDKAQSVTIIDPENKFKAFHATFTDVQHVLFEWGSLFILAADGKMHQLIEKDFETKLQKLFAMSQFEIAVRLAKRQLRAGETSNDTLVEIYVAYGNQLYRKKSFDDAIRQYIKTIGFLEPSYVIRKFLDSQRIQNLTDYLQALHDHQLADKHHTTLLLNCYTKLKHEDKLEQFVMTDKTLNFDLTTAIAVLRQAKYYTQALYLAKKFTKHEWYLKIQLENVQNYADALEYIAHLPLKEAEHSMKDYGKALVAELPDECTAFLKQLCTHYTPKGQPAATDISRSEPQLFIASYVNHPRHLCTFLSFMISARQDCVEAVYDTLLELYLREKPTDATAQAERETAVLELLRYQSGHYDEYQALVLTQMYDFKPGVLYLFEKTEQYGQIVEYYKEKKAYAEVLQACKAHGSKDRNLWVQALEYFAENEEACRLHMKDVLKHISTNNLLPPLMVIDVLARSSSVQLGSVKEYFTRRLEDENSHIDKDEKEVDRYRQETEKLAQDIARLQTEAVVFQDLRCSRCDQAISLPAVHFLCGHSFHRNCIPSENECIMCSDEHRRIMRTVDDQNKAAVSFDKLMDQLDYAPKRFSKVAEYFGQNLFRQEPLLPEQAATAEVDMTQDSMADESHDYGGARGGGFSDWSEGGFSRYS